MPIANNCMEEEKPALKTARHYRPDIQRVRSINYDVTLAYIPLSCLFELLSTVICMSSNTSAAQVNSDRTFWPSNLLHQTLADDKACSPGLSSHATLSKATT